MKIRKMPQQGLSEAKHPLEKNNCNLSQLWKRSKAPTSTSNLVHRAISPRSRLGSFSLSRGYCSYFLYMGLRATPTRITYRTSLTAGQAEAIQLYPQNVRPLSNEERRENGGRGKSGFVVGSEAELAVSADFRTPLELPPVWGWFEEFRTSGPVRGHLVTSVGWLKVSGSSSPDILGRFEDPRWRCPNQILHYMTF